MLYCVDMNVGILKNILKTAKSLKSQFLNIKLLVNSIDGTKYLTITYQGENIKGYRVFQTVKKSIALEATCDMAAELNYSELKELFNNNFSTRFLSYFCKSFGSSNILQLQLSSEQKNNPLIINFDLSGDNKTYIRYVLAVYQHG